MEKNILKVLDHIASLYNNREKTGIDHKLIESSLSYVLAGIREIERLNKQNEANAYVIKETLK